ncbi:MAG TPA: flagellar basal body P-ring formation protein FlgA [Gammaproteobacteria bacterium]|nr:flagellar basal body P-ring formation protein FlgA [Gammaproteobacteria bacterium]
MTIPSPAHMPLSLAACAALALTVLPATARPGFTPIEPIRATARAFLEGYAGKQYDKAEVKIGRLDRRLRLSPCEQALEGFLPAGSRIPGKTTVGVRCTGSKPWTVYVGATVTVRVHILTTTRPLARGEYLGPSDVTLTERELHTTTRAYLTNPADAVGKQTRRALPAGTLLTARQVKSPPLVRRGEKVLLLARAGALTVRMSGTALSDGARGDLIKVRNLTSRRVVQGEVSAAGVVTVNM